MTLKVSLMSTGNFSTGEFIDRNYHLGLVLTEYKKHQSQKIYALNC